MQDIAGAIAFYVLSSILVVWCGLFLWAAVTGRLGGDK